MDTISLCYLGKLTDYSILQKRKPSCSQNFGKNFVIIIYDPLQNNSFPPTLISSNFKIRIILLISMEYTCLKISTYQKMLVNKDKPTLSFVISFSHILIVVQSISTHLLQSISYSQGKERGIYLSLHCCFALFAGVTFKSRETFNQSCLQCDQCLFFCSRSYRILGKDPQLVKNIIPQLLQQRNDNLHHLKICSMVYFLSVFSFVDFILASVHKSGWRDKHAY